MKIDDLKVGDSIKNKDPYPGEGEIIVAEIDSYGILGVQALRIKYKESNGKTVLISKYELHYYERVKD